MKTKTNKLTPQSPEQTKKQTTKKQNKTEQIKFVYFTGLRC